MPFRASLLIHHETHSSLRQHALSNSNGKNHIILGQYHSLHSNMRTPARLTPLRPPNSHHLLHGRNTTRASRARLVTLILPDRRPSVSESILPRAHGHHEQSNLTVISTIPQQRRRTIIQVLQESWCSIEATCSNPSPPAMRLIVDANMER